MRAWFAVVLPLVAGCLEIGKTTYRFDTSTGTGTLVLSDVRTDTAAEADKDFGELVNSYVLGNKVSEDHPAWNVGERKLYAADGALSGEVSFTFGRASDVGLYQFDKKSPFLWCAADTETVVSTSGEIVGPYPRCVVFDRKTKVFEITVTTGGGTGVSLLPQFEAWDGKAVAAAGEGAAGMLEGMKGLFDALGSLAGEMAPSGWDGMNLPTEGGTTLVSTETRLEVRFEDTDRAAHFEAWDNALVAAGWKRLGADTPARYEKDGRTLRLTAVAGGDGVTMILVE